MFVRTAGNQRYPRPTSSSHLYRRSKLNMYTEPLVYVYVLALPPSNISFLPYTVRMCHTPRSLLEATRMYQGHATCHHYYIWYNRKLLEASKAIGKSMYYQSYHVCLWPSRRSWIVLYSRLYIGPLLSSCKIDKDEEQSRLLSLSSLP